MLTAQQARELQPPTDSVAHILEKIELAIVNAAKQGRKTQVEITSLVPQPESGAWMIGRSNPTVAALRKALIDAGYKVEAYSGGHAGRGYIRVSWGA